MFKTASGIRIPFPDKIKEEYQVFEHAISFNLSFEKIRPMLDEFIQQLQEPLFFVLELPLNQNEEAEFRKKNANSFHKKVCYLDGQSKEQIYSILQKYGDLLLNDGMSQFAVASHATNDEFYIQKYKVIVIYCEEPDKYFDFLQKYGLKKTNKLITPRDTFSRETPGRASTIEMNGINVYDIYKELVKIGLYDAKIVES